MLDKLDWMIKKESYYVWYKETSYDALVFRFFCDARGDAPHTLDFWYFDVYQWRGMPDELEFICRCHLSSFVGILLLHGKIF